MDDRNKPRSCADWQIELKNIAEGREPMDPFVGTMARQHALLCSACWDAFSVASADAMDRGIEPVPPMLRRVATAVERPAPREPADPTLN